jgi:hypothetical protein
MLAPGQHWEFEGGAGYDGRIIGIYSLQVELARWDEESHSTELVTVPISVFLSSKCKRNMNKERNASRYAMANPPPGPRHLLRVV